MPLVLEALAPANGGRDTNFDRCLAEKKGGCLSYRGFVAGAKATMMVAGAAASVGLAFVNDRRLTPAFVEAAPELQPVAVSPSGAVVGLQTTAREFIARRIALATLIGVGILMLAASIPAMTAVASSLRAPAAPAPALGPALEQRAAAGVAGNWEESYSVAAPPAGAVGAAVIAAAQVEQQNALKAMQAIADERAAAERAASLKPVAVPAPYSMQSASGFAPGTVVRARITIYGCTGPGGGFCNHMASGGVAFEGAAACSNNLPFGTKLRIAGDPTGRTYECLDRGMLPATWVDVYFENTSDGMAWQSSLGTTSADITIVN